MNKKRTLVLDRTIGDLWVNVGGRHTVVIWDVTGLKRTEGDIANHTRILQKGKQIGVVWDIEEIKERW